MDEATRHGLRSRPAANRPTPTARLQIKAPARVQRERAGWPRRRAQASSFRKGAREGHGDAGLAAEVPVPDEANKATTLAGPFARRSVVHVAVLDEGKAAEVETAWVFGV